MNIKECYAALEGNYEDVKSRLLKDDLIERFVLKFLDDESYGQLEIAMNDKNYGNAFRAVHMLKGLSKNFSFDRLSESTGRMTEVLRKWESEPVDEALCEELWKQVQQDYELIVKAINCFKESRTQA